MSEADHQPAGEAVPEDLSAIPLAPAVVSAPAQVEPVLAAPAQQDMPRSFPQWTGWEVLAVAIVTLLVIMICSVIALAIAHAMPAYRHLSIASLAEHPLILIGSQLASYPIVVWFMVILVRSRTHQRFPAAVHWNWPGRAASAFFVLGIILAFSIEGMSRFLPIPKSLPMDRYFGDAPSAYLMAIFGTLVAPLVEELFFRGLLYPLLRRAWGAVAGVLVTAAAFAAIHGTQLGYAWGPILSIFVVGIVLTLVRDRTDSVGASFLSHVGYNFTLFFMLWLATDHFHHMEKLAN